MASLTGACIIALGPSIAGIFTSSDGLAREVLASFRGWGEKYWRMPVEESYWESMNYGGMADMLNSGSRQGGAITAALFLKQVRLLLTLSSHTFFITSFFIIIIDKIFLKNTIFLVSRGTQHKSFPNLGKNHMILSSSIQEVVDLESMVPPI